MNQYAVLAIAVTGGVVLGAFGLWLLYKIGWKGGAASAEAEAAAETAKKLAERNKIAATEITDDELEKSLKDGSF